MKPAGRKAENRIPKTERSPKPEIRIVDATPQLLNCRAYELRNSALHLTGDTFEPS